METPCWQGWAPPTWKSPQTAGRGMVGRFSLLLVNGMKPVSAGQLVSAKVFVGLEVQFTMLKNILNVSPRFTGMPFASGPPGPTSGTRMATAQSAALVLGFSSQLTVDV